MGDWVGIGDRALAIVIIVADSLSPRLHLFLSLALRGLQLTSAKDSSLPEETPGASRPAYAAEPLFS
jgi:hypothetical protein